jgi:hypothetical protein
MAISRKSILVSETGIQAATQWLSREVEELEAVGNRILLIRYPPRFAAELGVGQAHNSAVYRGHPASAYTIVPYEIVIEHEH